jgi:hypothetical protein
MRKVRRAAVVAALLAAAAVPLSEPAWAQACQPGADFNGDGCGDLTVADPDAAVGGTARAGRVNVLYGGENGGRQILTQNLPGVGDIAETDDRFGAAVRVTHIDDDAYADLVVAVPSESVGGADDAGVVHVIFGSANGLAGGRGGIILRQGAYGVPGSPEAGDRFGASIAVNTTDLDGNGWPSPAVAYGVPGEDLGTVADAGLAGLVAFDMTSGGVALVRDITQDSPGISGQVEAGDRFGAAVEVFQGPGGFACDATTVSGWTLVVGAPGEDLGSIRNAGMVHIARGLATDTPLSQNAAGVDGVAESGDQFGTSLALTSFCEHDGPSHVTLAVGVPAEDVGSVADAGIVHLFRTDDDEFPLPQRWSANQNTASVAGTAESGDRFGATLALGGPWRDGLGQPVLVGVPTEDIGQVVDAGMVHVFGDASTAPGNGDVGLTQPDLGEPAQTGDHFGAAVFTRYDMAFVGVPDDVTYSTGAVHMMTWDSVFGAGGPDVVIRPGADGVPTGAARFGAALATWTG